MKHVGFTLATLGLVGLIALNRFILRFPAVGVILGLSYLIGYGLYLGRRAFPATSLLLKIITGALLWIAILTVISGLVYRFWNLKPGVILIIIALSPFLLLAAMNVFHEDHSSDQITATHSIAHERENRFVIKDWLLGLCFIILAAAALALLFSARTDEALRSPWTVVPSVFFAIFFVANLAAMALGLNNRGDEPPFGRSLSEGRGYPASPEATQGYPPLSFQPAWRGGFRAGADKTLVRHWLLLFILTALTLSVGFIVYKIGYGFDPFIHEAAQTLIAKNGLVEPKPWYYLGQYGLVTMLTTIFETNIALINKSLLPALAALTLPTILLATLRSKGIDERATFLAAMTLLALPVTWFINTTPQGLANLVLLVIIFAPLENAPAPALPQRGVGGNSPTRTRGLMPGASSLTGFAAFVMEEQKNSAATVLLIGLTFVTLIIHPLAGLPALMFILFRFVPREPAAQWWRKTMTLAIILGAILPLLFLFQERILSNSLPLLPLPQTGVDPSFTGWFYLEQRFNLVLDMVYYFTFNLPVILLGLAAIGILLSYRSRLLWRHAPYLIMAALMIVDGLILNRWLPFSFLINYERTAYGDRLLEMSIFFLLPFAAIALLSFFQKLLSASAPIIVFWILTIAAIRTIGVYTTYPRFDTYAYDRGYSTSIHDLAAVRAIEAEAKGPYIVLANQAASAAALRELGFKQYFARRDAPSAEQIFFYPIPTGGSLYRYYLSLVYEGPRRQTVEAAMDMVGVNEAYFVLNDYWADSKKIAETAKSEADGWEVIDGGKIHIFKYLQQPAPPKPTDDSTID